MTEDMCLLKDCVNLTLGPNNLDRIKYHTCTQKSESVNRAYLKSNPKCITRSRNFESRIHKVVHSLNQGHGNSTLELCESVGAPVVKGSRVVHHLKQQQNRQNYFKMKQKLLKYKFQRKFYRSKRYQLYDKKSKDTYSKSLTDPKLNRK